MPSGCYSLLVSKLLTRFFPSTGSVWTTVWLNHLPVFSYLFTFAPVTGWGSCSSSFWISFGFKLNLIFSFKLNLLVILVNLFCSRYFSCLRSFASCCKWCLPVGSRSKVLFYFVIPSLKIALSLFLAPPFSAAWVVVVRVRLIGQFVTILKVWFHSEEYVYAPPDEDALFARRLRMLQS
jgi:hypothetical protein